MYTLNECLVNNCLFVHFTDPIVDDPFIPSVVSLISEARDYGYIFVCPTHRHFHACRGGNVCVFDDHNRCLMTKKQHVYKHHSTDRSILYPTEIQKPMKSVAFTEKIEDVDEVDKRFNRMTFIDTIKHHMESNGISVCPQDSILGAHGTFYSMLVQLYNMFRNSLIKDKKRSPTNISQRFDRAVGWISIIADSIAKHIKTAELSKECKRNIYQNTQRSMTAFQKNVQVLISAYLLHGRMLPHVKAYTSWQDIRNTKAIWQKKVPISYWRYKNVKKSGTEACGDS